MLIALDIWKLYPKQIESGLASHCPGWDIGQWHRGEMSSRKLLVLLEGLPNESWFKECVRRDMEAAKKAAEKQEMTDTRQRTNSMLMGYTRPVTSGQPVRPRVGPVVEPKQER